MFNPLLLDFIGVPYRPLSGDGQVTETREHFPETGSRPKKAPRYLKDVEEP